MSEEEILPVGPREVMMLTWSCAGCGERVYRSIHGYRHVKAHFNYCIGHFGDEDYRARPFSEEE